MIDETRLPHLVSDATVPYTDEEFDSDTDTEIMTTPEFWENLIDEIFPTFPALRHEST